MIPEYVRRAFGLSGEVQELAGGSSPVYRVDNIVIKQIHSTSLETPHSLELAPWVSKHLAGVLPKGFRIAYPIASQDQVWMLGDGWMAWALIAGQSATEDDVPQIIDAIYALHEVLKDVPKHPLMDQNDSAWGIAHRYCWEQPPAYVHPTLIPYLDILYDKLTPLPPMPSQLIHGDLNCENILIKPGQAPGFIDFTPFWAPVEFALAMFANWVGPRRGDGSVLHHFESVNHFEQLLLRAVIRMLLVMSELDGLDDWETCSEKRAMDIVLDYVD